MIPFLTVISVVDREPKKNPGHDRNLSDPVTVRIRRPVKIFLWKIVNHESGRAEGWFTRKNRGLL